MAQPARVVQLGIIRALVCIPPAAFLAFEGGHSRVGRALDNVLDFKRFHQVVHVGCRNVFVYLFPENLRPFEPPIELVVIFGGHQVVVYQPAHLVFDITHIDPLVGACGSLSDFVLHAVDLGGIGFGSRAGGGKIYSLFGRDLPEHKRAGQIPLGHA